MSHILVECPVCKHPMEVQQESINNLIDCPKCKGIIDPALHRRQVPATSPAESPHPIPVSNSNLRRCEDCGKEVSIRAESCPHCGTPFKKTKRRGVFFYVFWGVLSLIGTVLILFVGGALLSGIVSSMRQAAKQTSRATITTPPKLHALTTQEKDSAQAVLSTMLRTKDEVTGTTWLKPPWAKGYDNQIYLYIGIMEKKGPPLLRLKIEYEGKEMLVIKRFVFRIDDTVETIEPTRMLKSDYVVDNYWESFDELADPHLDVVQKIANGGKVLMRYDGRQANHDRAVSTTEKEALRQMILLHRYLSEQDNVSL